MNITIEEFIVWLLVGAFVGSVIGVLVKRKKEGFGRIMNLTVGLIGALIGGLLFKLLKIEWDLGPPFTIRKENILAAVVGSIILLLVVWLVRKRPRKKTSKD